MINRRIHRRDFLTLAAGALATPAVAQSGAPNMSRITAYAFSFPGLEGGEIKLMDYAGKPILIVNTASHCGYAPQFEGLQQLHARYHPRGLQIVAVPSNDFAQEPGDAGDIIHTGKHYQVAFPFTAKTVIRGPERHPFYRWAATERPADLPSWNFHKYLVGRDGHIVRVFSTQIEPMDARVIDAVVKELPA